MGKEVDGGWKKIVDGGKRIAMSDEGKDRNLRPIDMYVVIWHVI